MTDVLTDVLTCRSVLYMNNETTAAAISLSSVHGRVAVTVNGELLGTVKDGGQIIRNAERVLKGARVLRATGYDFQDGALVATGYVL